MTVGIPGTGIGGLFYVIAALFTPLRKPAHRHAAGSASLVFLAFGILAGIVLTGWLLGFLLGPAASSPFAAGNSRISRVVTENVLRWASLLASVLLLAGVLLAVQVARFFRRRRY
jgi:hypothetical protein